MADQEHDPTKPHTLECLIEAPGKQIMDITAKLSASFSADGIEPCTIINWDQKAFVNVTIDFSGSDLARAFCLEWCVKVAFEGCGNAIEGNLKVQRKPQTVCKEKSVSFQFEIPAGHFKPKDGEPDPGGGCGDVYQLCVTAVAFDTCGDVLPYAGYCKGGTIMVFPGKK